MPGRPRRWRPAAPARRRSRCSGSGGAAVRGRGAAVDRVLRAFEGADVVPEGAPPGVGRVAGTVRSVSWVRALISPKIASLRSFSGRSGLGVGVLGLQIGDDLGSSLARSHSYGSSNGRRGGPRAIGRRSATGAAVGSGTKPCRLRAGSPRSVALDQQTSRPGHRATTGWRPFLRAVRTARRWPWCASGPMGQDVYGSRGRRAAVHPGGPDRYREKVRRASTCWPGC